MGDPVLCRLSGKVDAGDITHINGPGITGGQEEISDLFGRLQRLPGDQNALLSGFADIACAEGLVGALDLGSQLLQRDAVKRQFFRVRFNANGFRLLPDDERETDVRELGDFGLKFTRDRVNPFAVHRSAPPVSASA